MIRFITGKPGGGKGLVAMKEIEEELVNGDRPIITNLAIRVNPWVRLIRKKGSKSRKPEIGLKNYLLQKYGKDFDCEKRILILSPEDTKTFYLHRRNCESWIQCPAVFKSRDDKKICVGFDASLAEQNGGVLYVIDEAWAFFGSRDWQNTGEGVLFYAAQHRKLGDSLFIVTQHSKQVETALQRVAQDFSVVQNHSKKKIGFFRQPSVFSVATFSEVPTGRDTEPMARTVFKLDKEGLGACFDTAGGVGMGGGASADIGEKIRGIPFPFIILAVFLIGGGLIFAAKSGGWLTGSLLTGAFGLKKDKEKPKSYTTVTNQPEGKINSVISSMLPHAASFGTTNTVKADKQESLPLWVTATYPSANLSTLIIVLSDGRTYSLGDGHCTSYSSRDGAVIDGERVPMNQVSQSSYHYGKTVYIGPTSKR